MAFSGWRKNEEWEIPGKCIQNIGRLGKPPKRNGVKLLFKAHRRCWNRNLGQTPKKMENVFFGID